MSTNNVVFDGTGSDEFVECAARPGVVATGRTFRKQLLHFGSFAHPKVPGKRVIVDDAFADKLITNFSNKVCDIVQAPMVDDNNRHTENPEKNIGEVIDVQKDSKGIYAVIDVRDEDAAKKLGKTLIGASAMLSLDYKDTDSGTFCGPTLLHAAITNRPYITKLDGFEEIALSNADDEPVLIETNENIADTVNEPVLLGAVTIEEDPVQEKPMTKEELIAALKEQGIDVVALQKTADETTAALSNIIDTDSDTLKDISTAVVELSHAKDELELKLSKQIEVAETQNSLIEQLVEESKALKLSAAEMEIDHLIEEGRILPKQKAAMLTLSVNDRETFDALLPEEAIVKLSEEGTTTHQDTRSIKVQEDLDRYSAMARKITLGENAK
jgi:NADH dehydrogenase/NADH:ubiquinone oxidoreductase subunit G